MRPFAGSWTRLQVSNGKEPLVERVVLLVTSSGRRYSLLTAFRRAADRQGIPLEIIAAELHPDRSAAASLADRVFTLPRCDDADYIQEVTRICVDQGVTAWLPLLDPELLPAAYARSELAGLGVTTLISAPEAVEMARDKVRTTAFFEQIGVGTPACLDIDEALQGAYPFPQFIKPRDGSSSIGCQRVDSLEQLAFWLPRTSNPGLFEYVEGDEFTVDVYATLTGKPLCAVPRQRLEVRAGEVSKGLTVANKAIIEDAMKVVAAMQGARGVITLQCRIDDAAQPRFFEVNARFGGGAPLSIESGADFPAWILAELQGREVTVEGLGFEPGVLMLRYDAAVYVRQE